MAFIHLSNLIEMGSETSRLVVLQLCARLIGEKDYHRSFILGGLCSAAAAVAALGLTETLQGGLPRKPEARGRQRQRRQQAPEGVAKDGDEVVGQQQSGVGAVARPLKLSQIQPFGFIRLLGCGRCLSLSFHCLSLSFHCPFTFFHCPFTARSPPFTACQAVAGAECTGCIGRARRLHHSESPASQAVPESPVQLGHEGAGQLSHPIAPMALNYPPFKYPPAPHALPGSPCHASQRCLQYLGPTLLGPTLARLPPVDPLPFPPISTHFCSFPVCSSLPPSRSPPARDSASCTGIGTFAPVE